MRDRPIIAAGTVLFVILVTMPFWYAFAAKTKASGPDRKLPAPASAEPVKCVEPAAFMRTSHMKLLVQWREQVVRRGQTIYLASDGRQYPISLTMTCMSCHKSKSEFCDKCHEYAAVSVNCFDCHLDSASPGGPRLASARLRSRFGEAGSERGGNR